MKREEAVRIIKECKEKGFKHTFYTLNEYHTALDIAIKALEQEPCNDVISRQAVLDVIDRELFKWDVMSEVRQMPSVTPQTKTGHWIPVSEMLPAEDGFYLATCDGEICGESEPFSGLAEIKNGKWVDDEEDYQCVVAWMPLPEPYKPQKMRDK